MRQPHHLFEAWSEIETRLGRARLRAVFTDFDGTLLRVRPRPEFVRLSLRVRGLLRQVAQAGVTVGVVSGRRVEDVRRRVGLAGVWYVGAHGFFLRAPDNRTLSLLSPRGRNQMRRVGLALVERLRGLPGLRIEPKGATVAIHYRGLRASTRQAARRRLAGLLRREPGTYLLSGKMVWEVAANARVDKWTAVCRILEDEWGRRPGGETFVVYLGDDATDERVFRRMRGISVAVGRRHTAARYFLRSPAEVRVFLERLARVLQKK